MSYEPQNDSMEEFNRFMIEFSDHIRACKKFCVNDTEQIRDRIFEFISFGLNFSIAVANLPNN